MSKLIVTQIETADTVTPLTITTGNTGVSGSIVLRSSNNDILLGGNVVFLSSLNSPNGNLSITGNIISSNNISSNGFFDNKGSLREFPTVTKAADYTLQLSDTGNLVITSANVTVPNAVFAAGEAISIFNNSSANIFVLQGGSTTLFYAGSGVTGTRRMPQRAVATVMCVAANTFTISGTGLT